MSSHLKIAKKSVKKSRSHFKRAKRADQMSRPVFLDLKREDQGADRSPGSSAHFSALFFCRQEIALILVSGRLR